MILVILVILVIFVIWVILVILVSLVIWVICSKAISGRMGLDGIGWKSLKGVILRAPLCGANKGGKQNYFLVLEVLLHHEGALGKPQPPPKKCVNCVQGKTIQKNISSRIRGYESEKRQIYPCLNLDTTKIQQ